MNSLICWPLTPPWAFISATYISSVFFSGSPRKEAGPVIDSTDPIFTSACAAAPARMSAANTAIALIAANAAPVALIEVLPWSVLLGTGRLVRPRKWYNSIPVLATTSGQNPEAGMERSFKQEVKSLRLGAGEAFHGEGILAVTKALLQSGVGYVSGYPGAPISHLVDVLTDAADILDEL